MDAFTSLYVWQMMYLQMRLYDENFGEKFSSYRRIFAQISIWDYSYAPLRPSPITEMKKINICVRLDEQEERVYKL